MSSVLVNDENRGVCPVQEHAASEATVDFFVLDQPTGRPSILRQSQFENVNKSVLKGVKVCFQTPRRDPVTKKIMSPSRVGRMASLDDCTAALESLSLGAVETPAEESDSIALGHILSKNDVPYPDDDMPIQSKGGYTIDFDNLESMNPFQSSNTMVLSPTKPAFLSNALTPAEPQESKVAVCNVAVEDVKLLEMPGQTDVALDETIPLTQSVDNSMADVSADMPSTDTTVIIAQRSLGTPVTDTENLDVNEQVSTSESTPITEDKIDSPLPPKASYDFDSLELVDPFQTGGSKIQNSPAVRKAYVSNSPALTLEDKTMSDTKPDHEVVVTTEPEKSSHLEVKPTNNEIHSSVTESTVSSELSVKDSHMVLEFNFGDDIKRKPPPKRLGMKRPPGSKPAIKKPVSAQAEKKSPESKPDSHCVTDSAPIDIPVARGSYTLDFDDPNFNPFGAKAKMGSSPPHLDGNILVLNEPPQTVTEQPTTLAQPEHCTVTHDAHSSSFEGSDNVETTEMELHLPKAEEGTMITQDGTPFSPANQKPVVGEPTIEPQSQSQSTEFDVTAADEEFVPGSVFMPNAFDGQIDYLEQFGSSTFKESALRKQSLYLKFDPLLKESPKKAALDSLNSGFSLPRPSLAIRMMEAARSEVKQKSEKQESPKLLDDFPKLADKTVAQDPAVPDLLVPNLTQSHKVEDVIVDVLKYSQKDMDAAIERANKQAENNEEKLKAEIKKLHLDNQQMVLIMTEFEATITQITAENKRKEELAQAELSKVLQEKQQLAKDLNDMERSFSDIVKRFDKRKEIIEGFKKNEETLKQCVQSYLAKLQKQEQCYQMLKKHAEEKIDMANKEIAEVRSKLGAEVTALQVQLRREQLKVQSLEKNLEQKVKEVDDVTKLCDELIVKVQKH